MLHLEECCPRNRPLSPEKWSWFPALKGLSSGTCVAADIQGISAQRVSFLMGVRDYPFFNQEVNGIITFISGSLCGPAGGKIYG